MLPPTVQQWVQEVHKDQSRSLGVPWVPCMKKEVVAEVKIYASL